MPRRRSSAGFSLIEVLMVLAVIGILIGLAVPSSEPSRLDRLHGVARILATDLAYARSLALSYNSTYTVTFDWDENRYVLTHSGANAALDDLPKSPFRDPNDPRDQHVVDLDELPRVGAAVRLLTAAAGDASPTRVGDVEFGPLGETTRASPTIVWLVAGRGSGQRYLTVEVDPITGLADVGLPTTLGPPQSLLPRPGPASS